VGRLVRVGSAYGVDAWTMLAAIVARISGGRAIVAVGVGAVARDLPLTGEVIDLHGTGGAARRGDRPDLRPMGGLRRGDPAIPARRPGRRAGRRPRLRAWLTDHGARADFDVTAEGETRAGGPAMSSRYGASAAARRAGDHDDEGGQAGRAG
jgi:hypothetical protein